ncbi:hypothetical protein [Delftia sp. PE138]|uniref:hypothetical protein n=1 Tax=Delftia sp. PE138 TaxID=1812483 RepID=UPI001BAE9728|nr:hypothetical protein [Delftia sp. PE138]MBS3723973.1 hypothetical protein [Delftia sp. PE138]
MELSYTALIDQEKAKIRLLEAKIVECQHRIEMLKSFMNVDDLDALLAKSLFPESGKAMESRPQHQVTVSIIHPDVTPPARTEGQDDYEMPKRRLTDDVVVILRYVGTAGKTLDEIEAFCSSKQMKTDRGAIRSMMSNYKLKHGFIDSPKTGFFILTGRALAYLDAHYPVSESQPAAQSETPSVGAEGVSDFPTETAARRTESDDEL